MKRLVIMCGIAFSFGSDFVTGRAISLSIIRETSTYDIVSDRARIRPMRA
jgi:hypothetical protein